MRSYQEEHPLLKALPRELAEAAESDELLEVEHKHIVKSIPAAERKPRWINQKNESLNRRTG